MPLKWPDKDPDEVLDFKIDWTKALPDGDSITSSVWEVPDGITKDSQSNTGTTTTIWLSGGTPNTKPVLTNRVVTQGGRTMDQSVQLQIKTK